MPDNSPYEAPQSNVAVSSGASKLTTKEIYFSFTGRVPRKVFWIYGVLVLAFGGALAAGIIIGISALLGAWFLIMLFPLYILLFWVSIAINIKRWHDRDKSGWWWFIAFVPLIGPFWSIIEVGFLEGTPGDNRFGPAPADY